MGCGVDGGLCWGPHELGSFGSASALFSCASGARIDHNPPFFAFSSRLHFPKSIFEGNFGCGYLKERRASGLVFCENTTSVYRALFVSPPGSFLCCVGSAGVWPGPSVQSARVEWRGMLLSFSCMIPVSVYSLCAGFVNCNSALTLQVHLTGGELN